MTDAELKDLREDQKNVESEPIFKKMDDHKKVSEL